MKYLVMETHPAYAVMLDENGRFLKAANLRYQVGETVEEIVELKVSRPAKAAVWKPLSGLAALAACLCLVFFGYYQPNFTPYGALRIQINPDVELTLSRNDRVLELEGLNPDGQDLIAGYDFGGKGREDVTGELVERAIDTIYTSAPVMALLGSVPLLYRKLIVSLVLVVLIGLVLEWYFSTKNGLLLRAVGDNDTLVTTLAVDKGRMKILGLVIANALVALSGCIVCQEGRSFSATMGTGQMVFGLAAVIIGTTLFRRMSFVKGTAAVVIGSILYKACIQIAILLGLPGNMLKFITAALFLVILITGNLSGRKGGAERAGA